MAKPSKLAKDIKFAQNMNSTFVDPMLEKIFQEECKSFFVKYPINKFKASLLVTILMAKLLYWSEFWKSLHLIALLPWFFGTNLNCHFRRFIAEFSVIIFQLDEMEKGTFCESLGGFFPSFALSYFSFKRWDLAFYYGIFECLVLIFVSNFKAQSLICAVCVYTLAVYIAEKDTRDLWINCTSVSSQHTQYRDMFNISHNGIFVIDKDGNILNYNKKAAVIAQINGKTEEMLQYCKFYDIFDDDHRVWAKNIISTAMAGEKRSEEFICRKTSNLTAEDIQNLGFVLKTDLVNWNDEIAIRISFIDISTAVANRLLIINCYKRIQSSTEKLLKESIKIFEASNLITPNFISKLNTIVHDLRTQLIYQGHLISRVELKAEFLNLFAELNNVIELLYVKAEDKGLVINLNGANLLPKCVIGDKSFHNQMLNSIIEYLISKANMTSVIDITIIRNSISTNQVTIQYEFEFTSDLLKLQELDQLFQVRREGTRRKSFLGYVSMFKNDETGMFMFDMIVCLLRGFLDFNIDKNKGFISIFVPYMIAEKEPNCVIFCLHEKPLEKDPEVYTWHPKIDKIRKPKKNDKLRNRVLSPDIGSFDLDMSESSEQPGPDSFSSHSELLTSEDEENHNFETTDFSSSNFRLSMSTPIPSETWISKNFKKSISCVTNSYCSNWPKGNNHILKKSISSVCNDSSEATLIESASKSLKILIFTNLDQERKQFTKLIKTVINADIYHAIDPISAFTLYEAQVRKDRVCFMIIVCFSYTEKNLELVRNIRRIEAINEFAPSVIIGTSVNDKETELYLNAGMDDICNFNIVYPPISLHSICSIFEASYG